MRKTIVRFPGYETLDVHFAFSLPKNRSVCKNFSKFSHSIYRIRVVLLLERRICNEISIFAIVGVGVMVAGDDNPSLRGPGRYA
jgi:hypothetical protein